MEKLNPKWCSHWAELEEVGFLLDSQYHFGTQPGEWKGTSQVHVHRKHYSNIQNIEATCMSTNRCWKGNGIHAFSEGPAKGSLDTGCIMGEI